MGRPGNKRLQRAMYGASPSSDGSLSSNMIGGGRGRANVQRTVGSVINNGGNMMMGTYPTVGVGLPFLLKLSGCCKPGAEVQENNIPMSDISSALPRDMQINIALRFIDDNTAAKVTADTNTGNAADDVRAAQRDPDLTLPAPNAAGTIPSAAQIAAQKVAEDALDAAITNYNVLKSISDLLTARLNASTAFRNAYTLTETSRAALTSAINAHVLANPNDTAAQIATAVSGQQTAFDNAVADEQIVLDAFVAIMA